METKAPPKILIVDDEEKNRKLLGLLLQNYGYAICYAANGVEALALVKEDAPDLIFLDIMMPDLDGYTVCRQLKADQETSEIPVVMVTALTDQASRLQGLEAGASDFLSKPVDKNELLLRAKNLLQVKAFSDFLKQHNELLESEVLARTAQLRESSEQLARLNRHHELILCSVQEGILGLDGQGKHTFINPAAAKMLGCQAEDLLGCPSHSAWHHSKADGSPYPVEECLIEAAFRDGMEYRRSSEVFWRQDGSSFPVEYASTPIYEQGRLAGAVLTFTDITERKQAEDKQEKLQAQLNQAQKMEAIGILAGGIAHDFNNILSVILGFTKLAKDDVPPGSGIAQDLDKVLTAAHRATDLVKQILAFSRRTAVDRMPIQIQPLVKESLKMLRASLPTTITIKENIHPQAGAVLADPTQIHQIVMNLCTNAFHAMEKTGGVLAVAVQTTAIDSPILFAGSQLIPGEYVKLTVSDTGSGIGPDIMDKIFDPYFTTKEIGKGTGMGLSILHGIIKSYGGAITVESTVGQGTTFHVYFPVVHDEAKESAESQEAPRGKERILFVDDEELLAEMGQKMLEQLGYTVIAHHRSIEALAAFMDDPAQFDLVITDQTMPGLTGTDLAQRLLQVRPELPIVLCTGFSSLVSEESAKAIGIREFALKPLTKSSIGQLVRKVLDGVPAV